MVLRIFLVNEVRCVKYCRCGYWVLGRRGERGGIRGWLKVGCLACVLHTWVAGGRVEVVSVREETDADEESDQFPQHVDEERHVEENPQPEVVVVPRNRQMIYKKAI